MATAESRKQQDLELMVRCECGFVARGGEEEVVTAIQDHALHAHNMKATREQVLTRAQRV
jgi:predicted small metal-binding protein